MFCPECKSLMISSAGQLKCRKCGYIRKITEKDQLQKTRKRSEKEIVIVEEEGSIPTLPTIAIKCPKCENNLAFWWLRQPGLQTRARSGSSGAPSAGIPGGSTINVSLYPTE